MRHFILKIIFLVVYLFQLSSFASSVQIVSSCEQYKLNKCRVVPEVLKIHKSICETQYADFKCDEFKKSNPAEASKYDTCDYSSLCEQATSSSLHAMSCFDGLLTLPKEIAKLASSVYDGTKEYGSNVMKSISARNEWIQNCNKSIECKRQLAKSTYFYKSYANPGREKELNVLTAAFLLAEKQKHEYQLSLSLRNKNITYEQYYKELGLTPPSSKPGASIQSLNPSDQVTFEATWGAVKDFVNSQYREIRCYTPAEQTRLKCSILADVITGVALEKAAAKFLAKGGAQLRKEGETVFARIANTSPNKRKIVELYAQKNVTSTAENEAWLKMIKSPSPSQRAITVENAMLKKMNDEIFKDEEYVTAITNLYKDAQMERFKKLEVEIQKNNPNFKFQYFSDYKSVRVAYDDVPGLDLSGKVKKTLEEGNKDFTQFVLKNELVRESDAPAQWFKASLDKSDDWSNLSAKYARQNPNTFFVDGTKDEGFKRWVQTEFDQGKKLQAQVVQQFRDTSLIVEKETATPQLSRDAFEILRKNKGDPTKAKALIEQKFGLQPLKQEQFDSLRGFFDKTDAFSPGLRNTTREFATLSDAKHGGISIDMIGLGADHLQATSGRAFSGASNVDDFLSLARRNEETLTTDIARRKSEIEKKFKEATGDQNAVVRCSGDGCKAYLNDRSVTPQESNRFADMVTNGNEQGRLRFADISAMRSAEHYDIVGKQGEDVEKKIRSALVGRLQGSKLDGLNIKVNIQATAPNVGQASVHISPASTVKLTAEERKKIQEAFEDSLKNLELRYQPLKTK